MGTDDEDEAFLEAAIREMERLEKDMKPSVDSKAETASETKFVGVTRITAHEWCQQQAVYMERHLREGGEEIRTEAMINGERRHKELELEVVTRVSVDVRTLEDVWAVDLINFSVGLEQLRRDGKTREVPVFGIIQGQSMMGVIDELVLEGKEIVIRDHKTRQRPTIPGEAQKRTTRLQLMCYCTLLQGIFEHFQVQESTQATTITSPIFDPSKIFSVAGVDVDAQLSPIVCQLANSSAVKLLKGAQTLKDICRGMKVHGRGLGIHVGNRLILRYEWQENSEFLGEECFELDKDWMYERLSKHLPVLRGILQPRVVPPQEGWKCKFCQFQDVCPAPNGLVSGPWSTFENLHGNMPM